MNIRVPLKRCLVLGCVFAVHVVCVRATMGQVIYEDHSDYTDGKPGNGFASSIAVGDGIVAVGSWRSELFPEYPGVPGFVYIYDALTFEHIRILHPEENIPLGMFGYEIDIDDGIIAVGAPSTTSDIGPMEDKGFAYLFDTHTGEELLRIHPDDPRIITHFGDAIAIDDGVIAVWGRAFESDGSDHGSVFIFDASTGEQINTFEPSAIDIEDPSACSGPFGHRLALDDGILAINEMVHKEDALVVVVNLYDVRSGLLLRELSPSDPADTMCYASSISMDDGIAAVSTKANQGPDLFGAVYTYDMSSGAELFKYTPEFDGYQIGRGAIVDVYNGIVGIGFMTSHLWGVVHLFEPTGELIHVLTTRGGYDLSDIDIAIGDGVIGIASSDGLFSNPLGRAYFYGPICSPDLTLDDEVDFLDISAFIKAYTSGQYLADFDLNMSFDFQDISAFIDAYTDGCP